MVKPKTKSTKKVFIKPVMMDNEQMLKSYEAAKAAEQPWMDYDTAGENPTEAMKENDVRYIKALIRTEDGKYVHFQRQKDPFKTGSAPKVGKTDKGKIPGAVTLQERIIVTDQDKFDKSIESFIAEMEEEDPVKVTKLKDQCAKYCRDTALQWKVEQLIHAEFEAMFNDEEYQEKIEWDKKPKQKVQGNIQYYRAPGDNDDKKNPGKDPLYDKARKEYKLLFPIIRHRIKIDTKTGKPYKKIFEVLQEKDGKQPEPRLAMEMNEKSGKKEELDYLTIPTWLRMNSYVMASESYQVCLCNEGAILHASLENIYVRRGKAVDAKPKISKDSISRMGKMQGDDLETEEDALEEKESTKSAASIATAKFSKMGLKNQADAMASDDDDDNDDNDDNDNNDNDTNGDAPKSPQSSKAGSDNDQNEDETKEEVKEEPKKEKKDKKSSRKAKVVTDDE